MKKSFLFFAITLFSLQGFAIDEPKPQQFTFSANVPATFDAVRLARLDSALQKLVDNGTIPHAVTFVAHQGKVVHHKAYGWRNIESKIPCAKDDYFRMASQTKAITAVAVMTLFEEGKIQLDDPVKKFIPEFANPQVLVSFNPADTTYTTRPAKSDITIRQLLSHTSGISYGNNQTRKIYDKMGLPVMPLYTLEKKTLGEVIKVLARCPLEHDPGEKFTYGMSTDVLGYLIEVVSGMPIDRYLQQRIFEPLGMKNTFFNLPKGAEKRMVTLYQKDWNKPLAINPRALYQTFPYAGAQTLFSTGAGLSGTIEDYARFCQMILNGGEFNGKRILGRKTVELMCRNQVGDLRGEIGFGLAFDDFRAQHAHRSVISTGSLRWGGMFGTDYVIDREEELILLVYTNLQPNNSGTDIKVLFHNLVYQALK